jgi:hypothetical protein
MTPEEYEKCFMAGIQKRAEEYGITKEAFLQAFLPTAIRFGGMILGDMGIRRALLGIAKSTPTNATGMRKTVGDAARWTHRKLRNPFSVSGAALNFGAMPLVTHPINMAADSIANKFEPTPQQYPE